MHHGRLLVDLEDLTVFTGNRNIKLAQDKRSYYDRREGFWHVWTVAVNDVQVFIVCPYCGHIHCHGSGGGDYEGHRVEHCRHSHIKGIVNGYYIEQDAERNR